MEDHAQQCINFLAFYMTKILISKDSPVQTPQIKIENSSQRGFGQTYKKMTHVHQKIYTYKSPGVLNLHVPTFTFVEINLGEIGLNSHFCFKLKNILKIWEFSLKYGASPNKIALYGEETRVSLLLKLLYTNAHSRPTLEITMLQLIAISDLYVCATRSLQILRDVNNWFDRVQTLQISNNSLLVNLHFFGFTCLLLWDLRISHLTQILTSILF